MNYYSAFSGYIQNLGGQGKCLIRVFLSGLSGLWKNVLFILKSMREKSRNDIL
jgi:hypothetical protein